MQMLKTGLASAAVLAATTVAAAAATTVLTVGTSGQYATISAAVAAANADTNLANDYVISVAAGTYINDTPQITRPMTIEAAVPGSAVILTETVALANEKGILLVDAPLTVDGLTLETAEIAASLGDNGAGIRDEDTGNNDTLTVRNSIFVNNQDGILTDVGPPLNVILVNNVFINNGNTDLSSLGHSVYISTINTFTAIGNEVCGTPIGHDFKSRAQVNVVENNTLYDGAADPNQPSCNTGETSFALDLPNGGVGVVEGNTMIKGSASQNDIMFAYGEEGLVYPTNTIVFINNTMESTLAGTIGIYDDPSSPAPVQGNNNTFAASIAIQVDPASADLLTGTVTSGGGSSGISPDGSTLTAPSTGSLTTAAGVWTFGTTQPQPGQYQIFLNGNLNGGYAAELEVNNGGQMYALNSYWNAWYIWTGSTWSGSAAP